MKAPQDWKDISDAIAGLIMFRENQDSSDMKGVLDSPVQQQQFKVIPLPLSIKAKISNKINGACSKLFQKMDGSSLQKVTISGNIGEPNNILPQLMKKFPAPPIGTCYYVSEEMYLQLHTILNEGEGPQWQYYLSDNLLEEIINNRE